jgi:ferredoxin
MGFLFRHPKISGEKWRKCLAYLEEEYKISALYQTEKELFENALIEYTINANSNKITASEFQNEISRSTSRLAQSASEIMRRRAKMISIPNAVYPAYSAWHKAYSAFATWATAQAVEETEKVKVEIKLVELKSLGTIHQNLSRHERAMSKAVNVQNKLLKRLGLSEKDSQTLLENALNEIKGENWQPTKVQEKQITADAYERLAEALDLLPGGFPRTKSGVELQILKKIFSQEEALVASSTTRTSDTVDGITTRAGLPVAQVERILQAMLHSGVIWGSQRDGVWRYRLPPFIVGIYEAHGSVMDHEFAHLFEQYWNEGGAVGIMRYEPALHRVVPAHQALKSEVILPYDDVKKLMLEAKSFEMTDCICRKQQDLMGHRQCDYPLRVCFNFVPAERPVGQYTITSEEAFRVLDQAEEIGLVHTVSNITKGVYYVCNCCGCCCAVLRGITEFGIGHSVARANYYAVVDPGICTGCGTCEKRCQVAACSIEDGTSVIDLTKCIGCGICVTGCPSEALKLDLRPDAEVITPPDNYKAWEQERLRNRGLVIE